MEYGNLLEWSPHNEDQRRRFDVQMVPLLGDDHSETYPQYEDWPSIDLLSRDFSLSPWKPDDGEPDPSTIEAPFNAYTRTPTRKGDRHYGLPAFDSKETVPPPSPLSDYVSQSLLGVAMDRSTLLRSLTNYLTNVVNDVREKEDIEAAAAAIADVLDPMEIVDIVSSLEGKEGFLHPIKEVVEECFRIVNGIKMDLSAEMRNYYKSHIPDAETAPPEQDEKSTTLPPATTTEGETTAKPSAAKKDSMTAKPSVAKQGPASAQPSTTTKPTNPAAGASATAKPKTSTAAPIPPKTSVSAPPAPATAGGSEG
ncbi:hypothetical protein NLJ89_g11173 [Agrocybe chaxingu]|uniref:Uncharacterized protein n=1 Tax=Agrocybe chaxingu TaxID=84603 RepID=A0A9W8MN91_9AGAR|nr:hypothetical protein NLJ89_g11173 [Agrocybe chaxingu]